MLSRRNSDCILNRRRYDAIKNMIDYPLAKELKDAGFPLVKLVQPLASHEGEKQFCFMCGFPFVEINGELYHMPLVETLVEACGESFGELKRKDFRGNLVGFEAWSKNPTLDATVNKLYPTAGEAVARLLLVLVEEKYVVFKAK